MGRDDVPSMINNTTDDVSSIPVNVLTNEGVSILISEITNDRALDLHLGQIR